MCRVIAVSNQKGGVGKTVSCVSFRYQTIQIKRSIDICRLVPTIL